MVSLIPSIESGNQRILQIRQLYWIHLWHLGKTYSFSFLSLLTCTAIHSYPIFSTGYSVMRKVHTSYCGTSEKEHGLCACTVDNPLAKARALSLRTGAQTMLYLSLVAKIRFTVVELICQNPSNI